MRSTKASLRNRHGESLGAAGAIRSYLEQNWDTGGEEVSHVHCLFKQT